MKRSIKFITVLSLPLLFAACSDDSSSSPAANGEKYILHEDRQTFAIIYDRCYTGDNMTRWDENVDTTWFHYKFVGDTLIVFTDGNTADKKHEWDGNGPEDSEDGQIMVGGRNGSIFGTWKSLKERCYYDDGEINCDDDKDGDEYYNSSIYVLKVSKNSLEMSWELEKSYCPAEDLEYDIDDLLDYNRIEDYSVSSSGCNTVKFRANGKSVTATVSVSIGKDNVATQEASYTSGNKTCQYVFKKVSKMLQMPESLCNANDMSKYMEKESVYHHKYQVDNDDEFYSCLSEMLGIELEY